MQERHYSLKSVHRWFWLLTKRAYRAGCFWWYTFLPVRNMEIVGIFFPGCRNVPVWPGQTVNLGRFKLCINTYRIDGREMALTELIPTDGPDSNGNMNWRAMNATQYPSYYMGIHCFI